MSYTTIRPEWEGQTAFIIGGGPSVAEQDLSALAGRRVIVVNSSYEAYPGADALFFGDHRWWQVHACRLENFPGRIYSCAAASAGRRLLKLRRVVPPPGLAEDRDAVASQRTSLHGAMNLAVHLGVRRIVLLGADMGRDASGRSHHHSPHQWANRPGNETWDVQMAQFRFIVAPLAARGVEVINASPVSRIPWWPIRPLGEAL